MASCVNHRAAVRTPCRIVLLAAKGNSTRRITREVGVEPATVSTWRKRFAEKGIDGLKDRPRPGKTPVYGDAENKRILAQLDEPPPKGYVRWTAKLLAKALGNVHEQYIWRFLRTHNIDLAGRKSWCENNDPDFAAKAADVVGLYIAPPLWCALTKSPQSKRSSVRRAT